MGEFRKSGGGVDAGNHGDPSWSEYREVFANQSKKLCTRYVEQTYPQASRRGVVRVNYLPLTSYVLDTASPAFDLPLRISGPDAFKELIRRWRPTLARAWKARKATGSAFPHVAHRRGRLLLDLLWGDTVEIEPDPQAPTEWDLIFGVSIPLADGGKLTYKRDVATGEVSAVRESKDGSVYLSDIVDGWGEVPIVPMYRDDFGTLTPSCDRTLLDLHIVTALQLSDIEYRRMYRTNQMWRKSMMSSENKSKGGSDIQGGADAVMELEENDSVGLLESGLKPKEDLEYVENNLRLGAKTMKLPPELFITTSRAETGAAKSWDYRPLLEAQQLDRESADEWMESFLIIIRPILEAEKIVSSTDKISARTVSSKLPLPADLLQYALGVEKMMSLGLTSSVREISLREGVGYAAADQIMGYNLEQVKPVPGVEPVVVRPKSGPPAGRE